MCKQNSWNKNTVDKTTVHISGSNGLITMVIDHNGDYFPKDIHIYIIVKKTMPAKTYKQKDHSYNQISNPIWFFIYLLNWKYQLININVSSWVVSSNTSALQYFSIWNKTPVLNSIFVRHQTL